MLGSVANIFRKMSSYTGLPLRNIVAELEKFAPTTLAERWDNVGLLVEPHVERDVKKILLTNDLTEPVVNEAIAKQIDLIISYHPPIFKPLTRITKAHWKERVVAACLANSIAIYSPHTAWDKVAGGINDWLAKAMPIEEIWPLIPEPGAAPGTGSCRVIKTNTPISAILQSLQKHIENPVHVAMGNGQHSKSIVQTAAVCAGSGYSLLRGVQAQLVITGEMSHHELLDFQHSGTTVLLCNHSNSERGYLREFKTTFGERLQNACELILSEEDKDPLTTVNTVSAAAQQVN